MLEVDNIRKVQNARLSLMSIDWLNNIASLKLDSIHSMESCPRYPHVLKNSSQRECISFIKPDGCLLYLLGDAPVAHRSENGCDTV